MTAFKVKQLDETGAGDMFAGAFLHGVIQGESNMDSAKNACYYAGKVVSLMGARLQEPLLRWNDFL